MNVENTALLYTPAGRPKRDRKQIYDLSHTLPKTAKKLKLSDTPKAKPPPIPNSALGLEIAAADDLADASMSSHLPFLEGFVTEKTRARLLKAASSLPASASAESLTDFPLIEKQPSSLAAVQMRDYQLRGLSWLVSRYEKGLSCILAGHQNFAQLATHSTLLN